MIVAKKSSTKTIETLTHDADKRKNMVDCGVSFRA
jgi:hypothetical protein